MKICSFTWLYLLVSTNVFNTFVEGVPEVVLLVNPYVLLHRVPKHFYAKNGASNSKILADPLISSPIHKVVGHI